MAKQLNQVSVNLAFSADTSKVKAQLNDLQSTLRNLSMETTKSTQNFQLTKDIQEATRAAEQLAAQLKLATNPNTGNLDLSKFQQSLRESGMQLKDYQNHLGQLGPAGEQAFAKLARSITLAETPMRRSSKVLDQMWATMKNTMRWQLTSSMMHGFMGAVSSAFNYVKDLNESLNNIRIVTGYSTDQMAKFAEEANKAAQALSTTTTAYTDASLIFYQQGLSTEEVQKRTEVTIKMANAAGASAEKVSDQLTAVWNNFYDGTKSLEYYADVMTALGAKTASSTDEIAQGLEKFAAIGETIGLSYEYAASALATITSNTRQSADVVGTALKTIFARIQGLELGETLEDGVNLNKYSEALEKVGISIFEQNGELKKMDSILNEMGSKWSTLSSAQQTALAQTVAGVRQYNQLVSLMENWDSGDNDSMMANLETATQSEGTLQAQADIYAESWEAASKRAKAAAESVYSTLLNDEFFIDLTNGFADLLHGVKVFIDSLGGVKGVLLAIGGIVTNVFSKQIGQALSNAAFNLKSFFNPKAVQEQQFAMKQEANELLKSGYTDNNTTSGKQNAAVYEALSAQQSSYIANAERMSEVEKMINQQLMDRNQTLAETAIKAGEELEAVEKNIAAQKKSLEIEVQRKATATKGTMSSENIKNLKNEIKAAEQLNKNYSVLASMAGKVSLAPSSADKESFTSLKNEIDATIKALAGVENLQTDDDFKRLGEALGMSAADAREFYTTIQESTSIDQLEVSLTTLAEAAKTSGDAAFNQLKSSIFAATGDMEFAEQQVNELRNAIQQFGPSSEQAKEALRKLQTGAEQLSQSMDKTITKPIALGQAFSKSASFIMSVTQLWNTFNGILDVFNDESATTGDKIMALVSGLGMAIPAVMSIVSAFSKVPVAAAGANTALVGTSTVATASGQAISLAMWQVTLIVAAIAAVVALVAILISSSQTEAEKAQEKLKRAQADAEEAKNALEDAKSAYEDLVNTVTAYQDARTGIDGLTTGTEEFKQAVIAANEEARKLIELYNVISNFNAETGLIEITDENLEKAIQDYYNKLESARISNNAAQVGLRQAQIDYDIAKLEVKGKDNLYYYQDDNGKYQLTESETRSVAAEDGTDYTYSNTSIGENARIAALENLGQAFINNGGNLEAALNALSDKDQILIESLDLNNSELQSLCSEVAKNTNAILEANKEVVDKNFSDNEIYANSEHKNELNKLLATELTEKTNQLYEDKWQDTSTYGGGSSIYDETAQKEYAEMMGYQWVSNDGDNKGTYSRMVNGQVEEFELSDETVRRALAERDALEQLEGQLADYEATLNNVSAAGENFGGSQENVSDVLLSMVGGKGANFADATFEQIEAIKKGLNDIVGENGSFEGVDVSHIISEEDAIRMGYESAQAYCEALYRDVNAQMSKEDLTAGMSDSITKGFLNIKNLTGEQVSAMADQIQDAFNTVGSEAANALDDVFIAAGQDADELSALLANVDWGDPNAVNKLNEQIKEQGLQVNTSSAAWIMYTEAMAAAGYATKDMQSKLDQLRTSIATVNEVASELQVGDIISDEDYQKLLAINPAIAEFFNIAADGYQLIGSNGSLMEALTGNYDMSLQNMKQQMNDFAKDAKAILGGTNYFDEDGLQAYTDANNIASIAQQMTDGNGVELSDNTWAYFGTSKESIEEAANYIQKYTAADGTVDARAGQDPNFSQEKYDEYLARVQGFYDQLASLTQQYKDGKFEDQQAEELWASSLCLGVQQLTEAYENGSISLKTYNDYFDQLSNADLSNIRDAINTLQSGEELSAEQTAQLEKLAQQWPELAEAARLGADEYEKALKSVERKIADLRVDKLMDERDDLIANIDIQGNPEQFRDLMDDILDKDYAISVEIQTQLGKELDDAKTKINQLNAASATIGDNFIVAGEDIEALVAMFPGILENYSYTAEGMIQLDKDKATSAINAAKTEVMASAEATASKMRAEAEFMRQKAEIYRSMADKARVIAQTEVSDTDIAATMKAGIENDLTRLKGIEENERLLLSNDETEGEIENTDQVEGAIAETYQNSSDNAASGYASMANSSKASSAAQIANARLVAQANKAAAEGNPDGVPDPGALQDGSSVGSTYTPTTTDSTYSEQTVDTEVEESTLDESKVTEGITDWNAWADQQDAIADGFEESAEKLEAGAAAIEAGIIDAQNKIDGVNAGLGTDGKRDNTGSGSKNDKDDKADRIEDEADAYADIDAQIESINHKLEEQKKITENSEGEEKLKSLEKEKELLEQLNGKYREKQELAKQLLADQRAQLQQLAPELEFDGDVILNQVEILNGYAAQINSLADQIDAATTQVEKSALEAQQADLIKQYEAIKALLEQYKETLALLNEIESTITDNNYEMQGKTTVSNGGSAGGDAQQTLEDIQKENYEKLTKQLEIDLQFDDNQLKLIEHYLEAIADDFYQMGEAAALTSSKVGNLTGKLQSYEDFYNSLQGANISQEDLIAGMQQSADGIIDTLNELIALDKEMMEFYGNTLDAAAEELGYFTDQLAHHTEVLDHYRNIVEMINGEFDYGTIGTILEGATVTTKNEMDAAVANYEMLLREKAALEASLAMAPDEAARELYEKELRAITEACMEAENEMLDKTEQWAEAMKAVMENTMSKAAHDMELALTDGMSFDYWASSMDRLSSYTDEFLTKTNQLYETQKMINTAQQAIDKTTNNAAKARLKSYQDEIKQLQDKNILSQTELDLAQARYEVLLAEIALEEAQNAKATVRLQRDNEGNFGYVYTADQEAVSGAEQELADAQNALYNVGLEGANEYGQKMIELKQETAEALIELEEMRASGEIATVEEYEAIKEEILSNAYAKYELYSQIYTASLGADAQVQQEAWITAYSNMMGSTDLWKQNVVQYTRDCEQAYREWKNTIQAESSIIDSVLNHTESEVKDITNASTALRNEVVNSVIPAIERELQQVRNATSAYANQRATIQSLISTYQQLAAAILQAVAAQNALAAASAGGGGGGGGGGNPPSSSKYDPNTDYSKLMAGVEYGSDEYWEYYNLRQQKIDDQGKKDSWLTNDELDQLLGSGKGDEDGDGWFDKDDLIGLASGGYTGSWGPGGRLALLHEKELMLNPDDTINFLAGIDILRDIVKTIDLESLRNREPIYSKLPIYETQPIRESLEQQVSIAATFPAVTDRHEIEEAFNNLINTASQFANRKLL